jgi:TPR repeat protein
LILLAGSSTVTTTNSARLCQQYFIEEEYTKAAPVCQQAARSGDAESQTILGEMYDAGLGVVKSTKLTKQWWNAASSQGYLPAQNLLALKHYYGGDVFGPQPGWTQDYRKSFSLWQQSARRGEVTSQFMLGVLYKDGHGVERDYIEAYAWLTIALQGDYKLATDVLTELSRMMTAEQKHAGQLRSKQLFSLIEKER